MTAEPGTEPPASPTLVGREREQAALREALDRVLGGRASLVLIGGEAGIGKTTLAEATLAEAASRGALPLVGRCYDLAETPPYGPWAEALTRAPHGDGLPAPPDLAGSGVASQAALVAAVRDYLAALAARRPVVLLLEDLHWADPASLDLLRVVGRGVGDLALLLLATYRADELTRRHPLYQLLPTLVREARAARLDLRPLDAPGVRGLIRARHPLPQREEDRLLAYLHDRAEGNPFFTGELLRALEEGGALRRDSAGWALGDPAGAGVPPLLRQVIDGRIDRLGEAARDLLATAAVIGHEVPLALWATVARADEEALLVVIERAAEAHVLEPTGDGARFVHALIREALYEHVLPPRRRALHRRVAEALLAWPAPDPDGLANHLQQAGDPRAADWLIRAGARAAAIGAIPIAAARFAAAEALLAADSAQATRRCWLLLRLAFTLQFAEPRRGLAYLTEAANLAGALGNVALAIAIQAQRGFVHHLADATLAAQEELVRALAAYDALPAEEWARSARSGADPLSLQPWRLGTGEDAARVLGGFMEARRGLLAGIRARVGRYAEVLALGERHWPAAADRDAAGVAFPPANWHFALGRVHAALGRPELSWTHLRQASRGYALAPLPHLSAEALTAALRWVILPYRADRIAERRALAAEIEALNRQASDLGVGLTSGPGATRHALLLVEGDWSAARRAALALSDDAGAYLEWLADARGTLAALARDRGDPNAAWAQVRAALPEGPAATPGATNYQETLVLLRLAAALALDAGDLSTARAWLAAHDRWLAWSGAVLGRAEGALGWAEHHRAAGDVAAAHRFAEQALAHASDPRQPLALLAARRALGGLDTGAGHHAEAQEHLAEALALAEACAAPYERALTLLALAELRAATGERQQAETALAQARALLEPLGAAPALARAEALAARLAIPSPATPAALPFGLTAREAEVLRLVAQGLGNAQVAARLFVTPRTVNAHLTAVYAKLGVENRAAATAVAIDHGLR